MINLPFPTPLQESISDLQALILKTIYRILLDNAFSYGYNVT